MYLYPGIVLGELFDSSRIISCRTRVDLLYAHLVALLIVEHSVNVLGLTVTCPCVADSKVFEANGIDPRDVAVPNQPVRRSLQTSTGSYRWSNLSDKKGRTNNVGLSLNLSFG